MGAIELDLRITESAWHEIGDGERLCRRALEAGRAVAGGAGGALALLLTGDAQMQALNRDWRGRDKPTDVLSFPAGDMAAGFLGDIALGHGVCARDAAAHDRDLPAHLAHLVIHGLLHLYGHDHMDDTEAVRMQALESEALARLGLPDPYWAPN